jgi:glycerol kinase
VRKQCGLLTTVAYQLNESKKVVYALEGSVAYSGLSFI